MRLKNRNWWISEGLLMRLCRLILLAAVLIVLVACATQRRIIKNDTLDAWDGRRVRYENLFPPKYSLGETTAYDRIDFLKPHERKPHKYRLLADPRGGDIDRILGYDPADYTVQPDLNRLLNPTSELQITWIRHASFLIQLGGKYQVFIDPVLDKWDGLAGSLAKYTAIEAANAASPIKLEDLSLILESENPVNTTTIVVAISHDHLDHFNYRTLEKLPEKTSYYVPRGLENDFSSKYLHVTGMDWYTRDTIGDLTIYFLPANHGSGVGSHEQNQTLWGGWLFEYKGYRIYFAGDTGYSDVFKDIHQRLGDVDICLMPIVAWYWRHRHFAPEDAVQAAEDLGCKTFIPWGWGTWIMSYEHLLEPPRRLQYAWDQMQPENMELRMLKMGETYTLD
jgi:L-ascorbate metabolism protein UlaG (beta-lactamase superfamily)